MSDWQPIASAPKDGSWIIGGLYGPWTAGQWEQHPMYWRKRRPDSTPGNFGWVNGKVTEGGMNGSNGFTITFEPTHWCPPVLPKPLDWTTLPSIMKALPDPPVLSGGGPEPADSANNS